MVRFVIFRVSYHQGGSNLGIVESGSDMEIGENVSVTLEGFIEEEEAYERSHLPQET